MTELTPVTRAKIRKARDAWFEVYTLGYNQRRKALTDLIAQIETLTGMTTNEVTQLISATK